MFLLSVVFLNILWFYREIKSSLSIINHVFYNQLEYNDIEQYAAEKFVLNKYENL